ncbi:glycosyltransferase family 2 protein [Vagococcus fluvialis]|uniref:glycosyltransferase family 2 protein n=1 Tax=Vagococcus fluvialis TaxID=2738 RepID=UPI003D106563
MEKILSIIIPIYNGENTIKKCVESLKFKINYEILLIDDGSTDSTLELIRKLENKDSRIRVFSKPNEGVSIARNFGLKKAEGEFIFFLDADDYIYSSEKIENKLKRSDFDILVFGYIQNKNDIYEKINFNENKTFDLSNESSPFFRKYFLDKKYRGAVWNKCYRRASIIENNLFFKNYHDVISEDTLFNIEFVFQTKPIVEIISDNVTVHEWVEDSLSNSSKQKNVVKRTIGSLYEIKKTIAQSDINISWLINYYYVDYILKYSILQISTNQYSYSEYYEGLKKIINQLNLATNVDKIYSLYYKNNGVLKTTYHVFLLCLIKLRLKKTLSIILWFRYSKLYNDK